MGQAGDLSVGGEAQLAESLDPEVAFGAIDRGDTIGSTATTGESFGLGGAAAPGGARGGAGGIGGLGGLGGGLGALGNLFGAFGQGGTQATRPVIRTRLRSAIAVPPIPPARVQQVATYRFRSLPSQSQQLRGINVTMQGRTAVISGVVGNERDRRMSEMLMRLEPGVSRVDNRVVVMPAVVSPSDVTR